MREWLILTHYPNYTAHCAVTARWEEIVRKVISAIPDDRLKLPWILVHANDDYMYVAAVDTPMEPVVEAMAVSVIAETLRKERLSLRRN